MSSPLLEQIYGQLANATANEFVLEQSWMKLGQLLLRCKDTEEWRKDSYDSFPQFMDALRIRFQRGRTQLWAYVSVAEILLPTIPADKLEAMGISKALELKRAMVQNGNKPIPAEMVEKALEPKITGKEVRAMMAEAFNLAPDEKGTWFDAGGFYVTPDERKELYVIIQAAKRLLGIKNSVPEHIQRKEIILNWAREWGGTHLAEVYGGPAMNTPAVLLPPKASQ